MKASKFSGAQKAFIIKQGEEGTPVAEICRKAGISQRSAHWRSRSANEAVSRMSVTQQTHCESPL